MRIVNPTFALEENSGKQCSDIETVATNWHSDAIAIISNSKPNARELLEGLRAQMSVHRPADNIDYFCKDNAAKPATDALYDEIASNYKGAIVALAD
jgi:hypothetical protein